MSSDKISCEFLTVKMAPKEMLIEKEFFEDLKMMYSHSFLEWLIPNKLGDTTPTIKIGEVYFNNGANANNGLISDGFMNFGYAGIGLNFIIVAGFYTFIRSTDP